MLSTALTTAPGPSRFLNNPAFESAATHDEAIVAVYTSGFKSYARKAEAMRGTGITAAEYEAAKARLVLQGVAKKNRAGVVSMPKRALRLYVSGVARMLGLDPGAFGGVIQHRLWKRPENMPFGPLTPGDRAYEALSAADKTAVDLARRAAEDEIYKYER